MPRLAPVHGAAAARALRLPRLLCHLSNHVESFRESDWLVRLQHVYLLAVPDLLVGFGVYLSSRW